MKKITLLFWPLAALIGAVAITLTAPDHASSTVVSGGTSSGLLPS